MKRWGEELRRYDRRKKEEIRTAIVTGLELGKRHRFGKAEKLTPYVLGALECAGFTIVRKKQRSNGND